MLKRQGVNVKGLLKADPVKEEPQPNIDCTGDLQVSMFTSLVIERAKTDRWWFNGLYVHLTCHWKG